MKRILLLLLGIVLLGAAGLGFALSRLDSETLRLKVADMTREATGKAIYMATAPSLSFMPLGFSVGHASWGYEDGKPAASGLSAEVKSAVVRLELMPLLSGKVVVREVRLDSPKVTQRPEKSALSENASPTAPAGAPVVMPRSGTMPLELEQLTIINGSLVLEPVPGHVVRVDALNAALSNLKTGAEATIKLDMGLVCDNPAVQGSFSLSGHVRLSPSAQGDTVSLRQTRLSYTPLGGIVPAELGPIQMSVDGSYALADGKTQLEILTFSLQGLAVEASGQLMTGTPAFSGSVKIQGEPSLLARHMGVQLPAVPGAGAVRLQCAVTANTERVTLTRLSGDADTVSLSGDLTLELGTVPAVLGALKVGHLNLDAVAPPRAKNEGAKTEGGKTEKTVSPAKASAPTGGPQSSGKGKATIYPRVDLDISMASLTVSKITLENMHAKVHGTGGMSAEYQIDPLELRFATGGSQHTTARISLPSMNYAVSTTVSGLALGPLLQSITGSRPLDGTADAEFSLTCVASSVAAIKASLSGKGSLTVTGLDIKGVPVLPKAVPVQGGSLPTHFERLYVPFVAQKGVVTINGMSLVGAGLSAQGKGVVRLPQETINMTATVSTLGTQIPVIVSGPFRNLSYGVDPKWAARTAFKVGGALLEGGKQGGGGSLDVVQGAGGLIKGLFGK